MKKWLWLLLLPSLAVAQRPASINMRKDPVYLSVNSQDIVLYPDERSFLPRDLDMPNNDFERLLDDIEKVGRVRYVVLLLSPDSSRLQRRLRTLIDQREIDLGLEPWDPGTKIDTTKINKHFIPLVPESTLFITTRLEHRLWHEWRTQRGNCEIQVYSNSVLFLTNNLSVSWEELQIPDNPFDQMLDRWEAGDYFPSVFCKESGSDDMYAWIMNRIYDRGAKMDEWTAAGTPIEVPANGRAPIYLECRGDQLFAIAADVPAAELEISELNGLDPAAQFVCFLVRPDGFEIFRQARKAAWEHGLDVSCELQNESGPFAIGPEGTPPLFPKPESPAPIRSPKTQGLLDRADAFLSKAEAFSVHPFISSNQSPVHVEIWPERIAISPEMSGLVATGDPEKDFESLFRYMEDMRETHYFVLIPHPGGAIFQRRLRQQLKERGIDVMVQLPETHCKAESQTIMEFHGALPPRPASETRNDPPCDVEVRADAITILPDRNVVTLDELHASGNAFEQMLDRFEAKGECPSVQLCEKPGGEKLKSRLEGQIFLAGKSMGCQMKIETLLQDADSPPKPARTTTGIACFECRNGRLYDLSEPDSDGHGLRFQNEEDARWLEPKLAGIRTANKSIHFFVRPTGFEPYRNARMLAWVAGIPFSKTVLSETDPLPPSD